VSSCEPVEFDVFFWADYQTGRNYSKVSLISETRGSMPAIELLTLIERNSVCDAARPSMRPRLRPPLPAATFPLPALPPATTPARPARERRHDAGADGRYTCLKKLCFISYREMTEMECLGQHDMIRATAIPASVAAICCPRHHFEASTPATVSRRRAIAAPHGSSLFASSRTPVGRRRSANSCLDISFDAMGILLI